MKKNIIYASGTLCVALFCACTDLDTDIKSQYTSLPLTNESIEAVSGSVYTSLRSPFGGSLWMTSTITSDQTSAVSMGKDYFDGGRYMQLTLHTWNAENPIIGGLWDDLMNGIIKANTVIAQIGEENIDKTASLRAMRALYLFLLMDNFGDVPLLKKFGDEANARTPRAEVALFIESELNEVRDFLPETVSESSYGKATCWMVDALLTKLYINWNVYHAADVATYDPESTNNKLSDCISSCDNVIASGLFDLSGNYPDKFASTNGPSVKDFIFVVPFDHALQRGMTYMRWWNFRNGGDMWGYAIPQSVAGTFRLNPAYVNLFNLAGDIRSEVLYGDKIVYYSNGKPTDRPYVISTTKGAIDEYCSAEEAEEKVEWQLELPNELYIRNAESNASTLNVGNDLLGKAMGYRCIKFGMDPLTTKDDGRSQSNDVPVFRFADILLTKAEALVRQGKASDAKDLVNQIRSAVGATELSSDPTLQDILDERAREFIDEVWRRNDLIRFGKFEEPTEFRQLYSAEATAQKTRRVFCLPSSVLSTNPSWQQNAGY